MKFASFRRSGLTLAFACSLLAVSGCGEKGPEIVKVSGTVTRNGRPVPNVNLTFTPNQGRPSWGNSDANGRFTLDYDPEHDGAVTGTHKVSARFKPATPDQEIAMQQGRYRPPPEIGAITEKYGNHETTPLTVEIKEATNNLEIKLD